MLETGNSLLIADSLATLASPFGCAYSKSFKRFPRCTHIAVFSSLCLTMARSRKLPRHVNYLWTNWEEL
jgi:hypothetical protein